MEEINIHGNIIQLALILYGPREMLSRSAKGRLLNNMTMFHREIFDVELEIKKLKLIKIMIMMSFLCNIISGIDHESNLGLCFC